MNMTQVSKVFKRIDAAADGSLGKLEDADRVRLLDACGRLSASLETPLETVQRIVLSVHLPLSGNLTSRSHDPLIYQHRRHLSQLFSDWRSI